MFSINNSNRPVRKFAIPFSLALCAVAVTPSAAQAQSFLGTTGGSQVVCTGVSGGTIVIRDQECDGGEGLVFPTGFQVGNATFNGTTNATTFIGGTVQVNAPITITGPTALNGTTTFGNPSTFNALADFNNGITSNTITNSGTISTSTLSAGTIIGTDVTASGFLRASANTTVDMGNNRIQFVAAGIADTDAVNVAQLNAATSGITADVTALETTTATHTTQIAGQATQISGLQTTTAAHTTQITAIEAVNTTQSGQISAIQTVNTTQSTQISALEAASSSMAGSIDTLFDLRSSDRRDMKQGVAAAMSMASAPMPSGPGRISYAVNGALFRGEAAVGGSLMYRLPSDTPVAINAGFSFAGNKNNGVRVGVAGEF